MPDFTEFQLTKRAEAVLKRLIGRYIADGAPVSSRTLAKQTNLSLSAATIRNVMADLEEYGLIEAPHTSAGRVPTQKGYRFFINTILSVAPMTPQSIDRMEGRLNANTDAQSLLADASEMLSQITSFAGLVSTPRQSHEQIRQIEFLKLSSHRVLAILISGDGRVQNKVLHLEREYAEPELVAAANFFNAEYAAKTLEQVREELFKHLRSDHRNMHREMRTAIKIAGQFFDQEGADDDAVLVSGEHNFLSIPDFAEMEKLRGLFDTFKTKRVLLDLLQRSMMTSGVNIFIGEESGYRPFKDCSLVAAPYEVEHRRVGVIGVIGPTRMNYDEVISKVEVTAKLLGSALTANHARL